MSEENSERKGFSELIINTISIHPYEILPPDGEITADFESPVDAKSAQSGFCIVPDVRGHVLLSADKTEAKWKPACPMIPGSYTLTRRYY